MSLGAQRRGWWSTRRPGRRLSGVSRLVPAVVLLTAVALAGCAPSDAPSTLPEGVSAILVQQRADVAVREAQVQVRNDRSDAITVGAVELADPRFDGVAVRAVNRESSLAAGASVNVRVALPPMDCDADDGGMPRLTLDLVIDGEPVQASSDIADELGFLPGLHARECLGEALAEVAAVEPIAFTPSPAGEPATLRLAITPTGEGGEARIEAVQSTPLLMFDADAATAYDIGLAIDGDGAASVLEIPLVPQRCDPHVVQEDKRGTVFTFTVEVDGVAGSVDIAAPPEMKARMLNWVADSCGFGAG